MATELLEPIKQTTALSKVNPSQSHYPHRQGQGSICTYPYCNCIVQTSSSQQDPFCPKKGLRR